MLSRFDNIRLSNARVLGSRRPSNRRPYQTAGSGQGRTDATSDGEATLAISSQQPGRDLKSSPSNGQGFRELRGPNVSQPTRPVLCGKDVQPIEGKSAASSDSDSQASEDSIEEILCDPIPENEAKGRVGCKVLVIR
ncbi:hypothetical protein FOZ60_006214 [Perkinsus olseni]|uniref:Uncharacterized protein n=1 Tax=Perkinsus olseni TaxID=32597 RepID=A0A7J6NPY3_PEROL|nr:hypothetical protein FOZ60_006214 [Perkinsus olseni]